MATQSLEKMKPWALFIFVTMNVVLVLLILGENLSGGGSGASGFVRSTPEVNNPRPTATATIEVRPTASGAKATEVYNDEAPTSAPVANATATLRPTLATPAATGTPELSPELQDK
jgi:hypothetical protein